MTDSPAPSEAAAKAPATEATRQVQPPRLTYVARVGRDTIRRHGARVGVAWLLIVGLCAVFAPVIASSHPLILSVAPDADGAGGGLRSGVLESLNAADVVLIVSFFYGLGVVLFARGASIGRRLAAILWVAAVTTLLANFLWIGELAVDSVTFFTEELPEGVEPQWGEWLGTVVALLAFLGCAIFVIAWQLANYLGGTPKLPRALLIAMVPIVALLIIAPVDRVRPLPLVLKEYRELAAADRIEWAVMPPIPYSPTHRFRDAAVSHPISPSWSGLLGEEIDVEQRERLRTVFAETPRVHWMGTERNGADLLSRMIHACRVAIAVGFIATGLALLIGIIIGGVMGYFSGMVDLLGMRLVEIVSAIPTFFLLLTFVAFFDRNLYVMMVIIGVTGWVGYARFIRAEFLKLRQQDFVLAARACGLPLRSILFRHMLPNGVTPVLVEASFGVASAILYESTLSFLGLGLVDEPSWGQMLSQAVGAGGAFNWWLAMFPGLAIFLTVFAFNLLGESMRDAIDPRLRGVTD